MIVWLGLFAVIIFISLLLALRSMYDYAEMPVHSDIQYSLYLIKNESGLTEDTLTEIDRIINQKRLIISFERLYKGSKRALVVYGPVIILKQFVNTLDLIELEDYSLKYNPPLPSGILAWEISSHDFRKIIKPITSPKISTPDIDLSDMPLDDCEEIWWQLIIQPKCEKNGLQPLFKTLIRVVVIASDDNKANLIKSKIDFLVKKTNLVTVPQIFSTPQMLELYQKRSLPQKLLDKEGGHFIVVLEDVKDLFG